MSDFMSSVSEDERERLAKQRERSNKISKLMGNYLLKGYKMLGSTCNKCQTVLLRDRQGEDYCVGCVEVDVPQQQQQQQQQQQPDITKVHQPQSTEPAVLMETNRDSNSSTVFADVQSQNDQLRLTSIRNLQAQISWANSCMAGNSLNLEMRTQLVIFLRTCYETLTMLMQNT